VERIQIQESFDSSNGDRRLYCYHSNNDFCSPSNVMFIMQRRGGWN